MAFSSWYSSRRSNYRRGRFSSYGRSRTARRARSQLRAAMSQRDSLSLVIKYSTTIDLVTDGTNQSTAGVYLNIYSVLANSPMFSSFQNMYDQVKLDGARVSITQKTSNDTYQSINNPLQIVTAWDRSGLSAATNPTGNVSTQNLSFSAISQYSSAFVKSAMYGTFYRVQRTIYPSTLEEKGQWVSTGSLSIPATGTSLLNYDSPTTPIETGSYKFKPIFLMAAQSQASAAATGTSFGTFQVEFSIPVTFRGLRKL